ncbi:MAG TPA: glycosyltransferase [Dissulfurispiraceae bacterium]|nr:glycosyltransferase [Dissulfurispiraceae bacterium]
MRIVISASSFRPPLFGGGEVYVCRVAREFLRLGLDVTVVTSAPWKTGTAPYLIEKHFFEGIGVTSLSVDPSRIDQAELQTGMGPVVLNGIKEILQEHRPDLVHVNGLKPPMTVACAEFRIPHVVTAHHAGIACPLGTLVRSSGSFCGDAMSPHRCVPCAGYERWPRWFTGGLISRMPSAVYQSLGRRLNDSAGLSYLERGLIYPWIVEKTVAAKKAVLDLAGIIIAPSAAIRNLLLRNGRDPETVVTVPHGVEHLGRDRTEKQEGGTIRFGYVGRIEYLKGLHVILEALERIPGGRCELHVFGAPRQAWDEEYLKKAVTRYRGIAPVRFHGYVPSGKLSDAYGEFDVLIVPSLLPEAFGLVVAEAFSAGKPVIVFDSGALPEQVAHGENGFIISEKNGPSLAAAMQTFIENPGLAAQMSKRTPRPKTISEHADDLMDIYNRARAADAACCAL